MSGHFAGIQRYKIYVSSWPPILYNTLYRNPQIEETRYNTIQASQLYIFKTFNVKFVIKSLTEIRKLKNEKLKSVPEFYQSFTVTGVDCCYRISFV